jgi:hypothetical protein
MLKIATGATKPGQGWEVYFAQPVDNCLKIHVDTSSAGFTATPHYTASLCANKGWHWSTVGASNIYAATEKGFDLYIGWRGVKITDAFPMKDASGAAVAQTFLELAQKMEWYIQWTGVET